MGETAAEGRRSLLVFAALAAVIFLFFCAAVIYATPLRGLDSSSAQRMDTGWSYLSGGEYLTAPSLPCTLETGEDTLVLRHALTAHELRAEYVLTFRTRYSSIRVYADGELIYEAAEGAEHALSSMWHHIPMSQCAGCRELTVELRSYDGSGSFEIGSVLLDSPGAIRYTLLRDSAAPITFSSVCLLLTVVLLLAALISARWGSRTHLSLFALSAFMLLSGTWILLDSKITTLNGGNYALSYFLSYAAFYLLTVPYLLYVRLQLNDFRRGLTVLIWAFIANAALCLALHRAGVVQLRQTAVAVHALIILSLSVVTLAYWRSVIRRREKLLRFSFAGVLAVYACGLGSIALYHLGLLRTAKSAPLYILGLSLLIAGTVADSAASFGRFWRQKESSDRYRRLAVEDSMTSLGNRNAFQLHMAGLQSRQPERLAFVAFDVDDLKQINDRLGHHVGDQAIYTAAQCIRSVFGSMGSCFRIGGDEFAVIVTGRAVSRVPDALPRFAHMVAAQWGPLPASTGVSYGWASIDIGPGTPVTAELLSRLQAEADQSLYRMKQERKSCDEGAGSAERA